MTEQSRMIDDAPVIHQSFALADVAPRVAPLDMPRQVLERAAAAPTGAGVVEMINRLLLRSA